MTFATVLVSVSGGLSPVKYDQKTSDLVICRGSHTATFGPHEQAHDAQRGSLVESVELALERVPVFA